MKKKGLAEETIKFRVYRLNRLLKEGADLENPETVETILATSEWTPAYKRLFIDSYKAYATYRKIEWQKPKCVVPDKEPFLPQEEEVKQLIAGTGKRTSTLLQLLYETGARIGEASSLLWTDIDFKTKQIRINCPEKGSNSRTLEISDALLAMLNALPKRQDNHLFNPRVRTLQSTFAKQRGKLAKQLQNPRIKQIHFHTLRHLKATSEYYKTGGDILRVKYVLGHKRLDTTSKYAHYQAFRSEEYTCKATANNDEASQLIENGFEYVLTTPDGLMLFRKRK
jgi:integrase